MCIRDRYRCDALVGSQLLNKDEVRRLKEYIDFCLRYIQQGPPLDSRDRSSFYIIRYLVIGIARLITSMNLANEISKKCQDTVTLIKMGDAFLQARYSYANSYSVYTILKNLCPCIGEYLYKLWV